MAEVFTSNERQTRLYISTLTPFSLSFYISITFLCSFSSPSLPPSLPPLSPKDCANYMLESGRGEKVRHAMSALLVEVLTPVASVIKYEASMPAFKKIVSTLYSHAYDQAKRKHSAVSAAV